MLVVLNNREFSRSLLLYVETNFWMQFLSKCGIYNILEDRILRIRVITLGGKHGAVFTMCSPKVGGPWKAMLL